ncbi:MAG: O-antigen ligase family protein [Candidatus Promineifilaceae bacterium]|nr:O-antigen ligase family protein [Candidatus Promineifilaceae bacterium]
MGHDILLALVVAVVLAMATLMFAKPETTTVVVLFVLYANLSVVAMKRFEVPELLAASFFLLLGLPFLNYVIVRRQSIVTNRIFFLMVLYLSVLLVSAAFSTNPEDSTSRILGLILEGLALYFLIINAIRTPQMVRWGIWAIVLAGLFMGSITLYQEVTGDYDNDFGGLAQVKSSEVDTGEVDQFGREIKRRRLSGTLGSKNRYAQVMVALLPFALMLIWSERNIWLKLLAAVSCVPIVTGALLTFSRGAGIAIIFTIIMMLLLRIIKPWHFLIFVIAGYLTVIAIIPEYIYRISTVVDLESIVEGNTQEAGGSIRSRSNVNLATFNIFLDHPLLGTGPGQTNQFTSQYGNEIGTYYRAIDSTRRAHNMFLEELADTGVFGFVLFMSIALITMFQVWKVRQYGQLIQRPDISYTAAGFFMAIIAYMATAMFLHLSYVRYYWFLLAFAGAFVQVYRAQAIVDESRISTGLQSLLLAATGRERHSQ